MRSYIKRTIIGAILAMALGGVANATKKWETLSQEQSEQGVDTE